jgi:hypothetical protein
MKKTKSKTRRTAQQQRAAEILQFIRAAAKKNYRHTGIQSKPKSSLVKHKSDHKRLKDFLQQMHQL